jgi:hypothetical protein
MVSVIVPVAAQAQGNTGIDRTSIFVEAQPWTFERRDVETDYEDGNLAVIRTGLNPGERVGS